VCEQKRQDQDAHVGSNGIGSNGAVSISSLVVASGLTTKEAP
jgi:hypothetical protein